MCGAVRIQFIHSPNTSDRNKWPKTPFLHYNYAQLNQRKFAIGTRTTPKHRIWLCGSCLRSEMYYFWEQQTHMILYHEVCACVFRIHIAWGLDSGDLSCSNFTNYLQCEKKENLFSDMRENILYTMYIRLTICNIRDSWMSTSSCWIDMPIDQCRPKQSKCQSRIKSS